MGPELLSELRMTLVEQTKHREAALEDPSALVRVQQDAPTLAALIRPSREPPNDVRRSGPPGARVFFPFADARWPYSAWFHRLA
jgi:hypothetical protein